MQSSSPEEIVQGTSPYGLSEQVAAKLLVDAVNHELVNFELQSRKKGRLLGYYDKSRLLLFPSLLRRIPQSCSYVCTEDGFLGLLFLIVLAGELLANIGFAARSVSLQNYTFASSWRFDEYRWEYTAVMLNMLPLYILTGWWYQTSNRVESIRASSHIREALTLYQHCLKGRFKLDNARRRKDVNSLYSPVAPPSEYDIPSCTFISVLRNAEWRRLPYNLVVQGDVIKLRFGDVAPCDLVQVILVKMARVRSQQDPDPCIPSGDDCTPADECSNSNYVLRSTGRFFRKGTVFGLNDIHVNPVCAALRYCPELSYAIFVVLQTPCVTQVHRFLASTSNVSKAHRRSRNDTAFIDFVERAYCHLLRPVCILYVILSTLNVIIRAVIHYSVSVPRLKQDSSSFTFIAVPVFPIATGWLFYTTPLYILMIFIPMVPRLIINITDLWGNARLQSLFLFHHERRYRAVPINDSEDGWLSSTWLRTSRTQANYSGRDAFYRQGSVQSIPDSTTSSLFSETGLSRPSSADTAMSISRVPWSKQIQEIRNVFRQGLDGSVNLLHTLDSSTYLAFLDHSGLLIDTCRRVQEVCVVSEETNENIDSKVDCLYDVKPSVESEEEADITSPEKERSLRPYTLPIITTEKDAGFHYSQSGSCTVSGPTEWKSQDSCRGLRFVDNAESSRLLPILRPFTLAMRVTQLPPVFRVNTKGLSVAWLHTWRLHDFFQRDFFDVDDWQECLCGLTTLTDMPPSSKRFKTVRHVLAVDFSKGETGGGMRGVPGNNAVCHARSQIVASSTMRRSSVNTHASATPYIDETPISNSSETIHTLSTEAHHITIQDSPFFIDCLNFSDKRNLHVTMLALVKDNEIHKTHLFSKSRPEVLIAKCSSCFDGKNVRPMTKKLSDKLEAVLVQWRSQGFDVFGFGYAPLSATQQTYLLHSLEEHTVAATITKKRPSASTNSLAGRRQADSRRKKGFGTTSTTLLSMESNAIEQWRPLVSLPGPRSVTLRPEPFVCSEQLLPQISATHSSIEPFDISDTLNMSEFTSQLESMRLMNYDNTIVTRKTRGHYRKYRSATNKPCPEDDPEFEWKASWLPLRTTSLGLDMLKKVWEEHMVFLGLTAIKNVTYEDVPERIADFHAAGVRVSIFSRLPIKQTRILGSILGLETGWNCLISLEENDKEAVYVNQDGNEVLPAGIPHIKKHLREIDDIPLLVSLYANSTSPTTREMLRILEANGEIVTCIGSALRTSNFDLFTEASCPVSILLLPYPLCNECHARRNIGEFYNPVLLPELSFSAALTSLPCALQSHAVSFQIPIGLSETSEESVAIADEPYPSFLMQLLYSLFQEARRLVASIELVVLYYVTCSVGIMGSIVFLQNLLAIPNLFSPFTMSCWQFLLLPLPAIALAFNPARESTMLEFPRTVSPEMKARRIRRRELNSVSPDMMPTGVASSCSSDDELTSLEFATSNSVRRECVLNSLPVWQGCKVLTPVISTIFLGLWFLREGAKAAARENIENGTLTVEWVQALQESCLSNTGAHWFNGMWSKCIFDLGQVEITESSSFEHTTGAALMRQLQCLSLIIGMLHCFVLSLASVDRFESIFASPPWTNHKLLWTWLATIFLAFGLINLRLLVPFSYRSIVLPSFGWWLTLFAALVFTLVIAEGIKHFEKRRHQREQKFLRLLFQTRLGMWSPK